METPAIRQEVDKALVDHDSQWIAREIKILSHATRWPKGYVAGPAIVSGPIPALDFTGREKGYMVYNIEIQGEALK